MFPFTLTARVAASAVDNARRAALDLRTAVRDRAALRPDDGSAVSSEGRLAALSREEALELLGGHHVGRLCYIARAGVPDVVPVNYLVDGDQVLVRSGPGPKLQAGERREVVALEVDELDEQARTGRSVVVSGPARGLREAEVRTLGVTPEPWATGPRRHVLAVDLRRVTGRRLG